MPDENKPTNLNQPTDQVVTPSTPQDTPDIPTPPSPSTDTPLSPLMDDGSVSPPPPIVEEKKEPEQTTTQQQDADAPADSPVDTDIPPVITTAGTPKRKFGKKTIATILGVLFLVGGIGAGVILVQQRQDIREEAYTCKKVGEQCGVFYARTIITSACCSGLSCSDIDYTTRRVLCKSLATPAPTPYCSRYNEENCVYGCEKTTSGGVCKAAPAPTRQCPSGTICRRQTDGCPIGYTQVSGSCEIVDSICCKKSATPAPTRQCPSGTICRKQTDGCPSGYTQVSGSCEIVDSICCTKTASTPAPAPAPTSPDHPNCNTNKALYFPSDCSGRLVKDHIIREFCNAEDDKYWCKEWQLDWGVPCWCAKPSDYPHVGKDYWLKPAPGETKLECGTSPDPRCINGPAPGITAACLDIKAFDSEWTRITNLSSLKAGDVVRFTVSGSASSGSFDKARFIINSVTRPEATTKRPGTEEFYDEYTIPEDVTSFTINARIHHSSLGWF